MEAGSCHRRDIWTLKIIDFYAYTRAKSLLRPPADRKTLHIHERSGLGPILGSCATPRNHAYTRAKWTWAYHGLRTTPLGTPLNYAYTRAKWTWAHSELLFDPSQLCIYTSEVDLGPFWAQNGSLRDPYELCIYTSEVGLAPFWAQNGPPSH
jgi:hypothetical protein